jgi:hypothetical protein
MKRVIYFLTALLFVFFMNNAFAQIPRVISYQGQLLGTNEQPVPEGDYKLTFKIYNESNTLLWAETHNPVHVAGGLFQVFLGSVIPLNIPFNQAYFMGIQVGSDPEMIPRIPITSSAYSFSSGQVCGINNVFPADGNVGIGIVNPDAQYKLHVAGLARFDLPSGQISISTPGGWPGFIMLTPQGHRRDIIIDDPDPGSGYKGGISISTSKSSAAPSASNGITITEDGYLGVGTWLPQGKLDIDFGATGAIRAGTPLGQGPGWIFIAPNGHRRDVVAGTPGFYIGASTTSGAPSTDFIIAEGGKVGIGLPGTTPGNILTIVQNSATDPIADAWTTYSSKRWKTNIQPIENALDKVQRLRGVTFDWKKDGKHDIGLVAEEVGQVIPEVVAFESNKKDAKSVDYSRLVAVLIEAVKAQQKEIESLKATVESLKAE